jgi:hypothetical protein
MLAISVPGSGDYRDSRNAIRNNCVKDDIMAGTTKLSVEKALEKLRRDELQKTKTEQRDEKTEALQKEIKRMRTQRHRLDPASRKRS